MSTKPKVHRDDEEFISDYKAAFLNKTTFWANSILYALSALLIIALIWAYFAQITQVTTGQGIVISSSYEKVIQSLDGGIVKEIMVHEGDLVHADQPIMLLDPTRTSGEYEQANKKYLALLAMVARLTAESKNQDEIIFPSELNDQPDLISRETHLFETRRRNYQEGVTTLQKGYDLGLRQTAILEPLVKKGVASELELTRTERETNDSKSKLLDVKNKFQEQVWTDLNDKNAELAQVKENLTVLKDKMVHATIRSPVYGMVKKIHISTVGGVIQPGNNIMEIVPLEDTLLVQVHVNPADIAFIHLGQSAVVKITAYDYSIFADLQGKIEYISPDVVQEEKASATAKDTGPFYLVNVRTSKSYLDYKGSKLPIIPGMGVSVQIQTGTKTVMQYLLKPLMKAKTEALHEH
jgi:adhesin transport system membrane fusion protein